MSTASMFSVKQLVESGFCAKSMPSKYVFPRSDDNSVVHYIPDEAKVIPTIDFSLLTSGNPDQRSKVISDLGNACREWGFFMLINHGVSQDLMDEVIKVSEDFFDLKEEDKRDYAGKTLFDPIRWGTSFNVSVDKTLFWRDYLKIHVHPQFNAPKKPVEFSETLREYCERSRKVASELLKGISESLGLGKNYINKKMKIESGLSHQLLVINLYPPCPEPDVAMGLPPHTDHGLLTLLMQNQLCGLQVLHDSRWVPVNPLPYSFLVISGDHMEILTNGKYKSVVHRALVNNNATRISVGTGHGPSLDTIVSPVEELVNWEGDDRDCDRDRDLPAYRGIRYREYMELQQSNQLNGNSCLDHVRIL
ncbi:putative 2-oxoglutarate/Fe(II)-dependent dioxygenase [Morus notabilis]|uniref:Putative 2-oxoglutarate/Fe(II)-dependent dioxygenase n=1 Tax=Morus notabilis TaxID=981085 RepID=W9RG44_9ROSA|nr:protein DMR6-LIKE OXYGENASE 2 [Morus notabilis]XP_024022936.1 protein DMR6-LIKE OXYGENASE 2 [Morus notabilis]EXB75599.1 putative 2-oxoglutarate/Fe(II)-dependent dioxygenase [Morus notabilis]